MEGLRGDRPARDTDGVAVGSGQQDLAQHKNADHIAAANPDAVLALVADRRRLAAENEKLRERNGRAVAGYQEAMCLADNHAAEWEAVQRENENLRATFEVVATSLVNAEQAKEDDLPCKAIECREGAIMALAQFKPRDDRMSQAAAKLRSENYSLFASACTENEKLRAERDKTEAALRELCHSLYVGSIHDEAMSLDTISPSRLLDRVCRAVRDAGLWREPKEAGRG